MLADLLSESYDADLEDAWENERRRRSQERSSCAAHQNLRF
jgi:hypothetical protein